jgi:tetratricopeptide (TPR) repeat protein
LEQQFWPTVLFVTYRCNLFSINPKTLLYLFLEYLTGASVHQFQISVCGVMQLGEFRKAVEDSSEAIRLAPGYTKAYHRRGTALSKLGDLEGALHDYQVSSSKQKSLKVDLFF